MSEEGGKERGKEREKGGKEVKTEPHTKITRDS